MSYEDQQRAGNDGDFIVKLRMLEPVSNWGLLHMVSSVG